jgi:hypothetical protein
MSNGRIKFARPPILHTDAPPTAARPLDDADDTVEINKLYVRRTGGGWSLMVDDLSEPAWTLDTKRQTVSAARDSAQDLGVPLVIERADGTVQETLTWS